MGGVRNDEIVILAQFQKIQNTDNCLPMQTENDKLKIREKIEEHEIFQILFLQCLNIL